MSSAGARLLAPPSAAEIVSNAEWLPHTFNATGDFLTFVRASADFRRSTPFLSGEWVRELDSAPLPFGAVRDALAGQGPVPLHFIFHTAFCGSTLLLNALEGLGVAAGLKEPAILLNMHHRFIRGCDPPEHERLGLVLKLLGRPFEGTGAVVAKPSCFVNPLIPHIMRALSASRALLLHSDLSGFLFAVAKRGIRGRTWGRKVYASCRSNIPLDLEIGPEELLQQTDLQVAGLGWLMRRALFNKISTELGPSRVIQVRSDDLYQHPVETLQYVASFFNLRTTVDQCNALASSNVFRTHSKEPGRVFGAEQRLRERDELRGAYGEEVEIVSRWVEAVARENGVDLGDGTSRG